MTLLLHLLLLVARYRVFVVVAIVAWGLLGGRGPGRRRLVRGVVLAAALATFLGSPILGAWWLYRVGQPAVAQVTGTYATYVNVNDRDVIGYRVLIRAPDGSLVPTRFEDDEFVLFPPEDFALPQSDETFGVRYLQAFPRDFVIVTDDGSPWAHRQGCYVLVKRVEEARQRFDFARGAAEYRQPYVATIDGYLAAGCAEGFAAQSWREDRARALAGQADAAP